MPIQVGEHAFKCSICGKIYEPGPGAKGSPSLNARSCEISHDVIYLPVSKEDLGKLIQFIYTKEDRLISEKLYNDLLRYYNNKGA